MMNNEPAFRGVYLFAESVQRSVTFYRLLGLTVELVSDVLARVSWQNGVVLEIGGRELTRSYDPSWETPGSPSKNSTNFEFSSAQAVDDVYQRMTEAGYRSQLTPCVPPWMARFAIINDPDGNIIGLHGPRNRQEDRARERGG